MSRKTILRSPLVGNHGVVTYLQPCLLLRVAFDVAAWDFKERYAEGRFTASLVCCQRSQAQCRALSQFLRGLGLPIRGAKEF